MPEISHPSSVHRPKKADATLSMSGTVIPFQVNAKSAGVTSRPHVPEPSPVRSKAGTLDDAILEAASLPRDTLLLALDLGVTLADRAAAEDDEALFYQRIMGMYAVTARILREGDRL